MSGKRYDSVLEMVRGTASPEFVADMERALAGRDVIDRLASLRCLEGVSATQLAARLGADCRKVYRIENRPDACLRLGDVVAYAAALGYRVDVTFTKE